MEERAMTQKDEIEKYRHHVKPALVSKAEEFKILDYGDVTESEIWNYLRNKKWKKKTELMVHEMVADIMAVKPSEFMTFATIESFKSGSWFDSEEGRQLGTAKE